MSEPRTSPYVYVTWITRLLAGEDHCQWKSWFRSHFKWQKLPSDFDLAQWTVDHTRMVKKRAEDMRAAGYTVYLENQNEFHLRAKDGTVLAGKPDIVGIKDGRCLVVDCKTGKEKHSDKVQVMVYMLILPKTHTSVGALPIDGEVMYKSGSISVRSEDLSDKFRNHLKDVMAEMRSDAAPDKSPSASECRFCDIGEQDCPDRIEREAVKHTDTEVF